VILTGSRVYGDWQPSSDLDVRIIVNDDFVERRYMPSTASNYFIPVDIGVDPFNRMKKWIDKNLAYADMIAKGQIVYPQPAPAELLALVERAARRLAAPPTFRYSYDHHVRFLHTARVLDRAKASSLPNQQLALAYAISSIALLRLMIDGKYQFFHYAMLTQLESVDVGFAARFRECLTHDLPKALDTARELLELLNPDIGGTHVG
jgi:hypothetical protein